jgi:phosphatidylglycerol:prolipoprotein diacylglycerol transferase
MLPYAPLTTVGSGVLTLQTWGLCVAAGVLAALFLSLREARRRETDTEVVWDVVLLALGGMILGGKAAYLALGGGTPDDPLAFPQGGFSLLGGALVAGSCVLFFLRRRKEDVRRILDLLTPGLIVALLFARLGCFLVNDHVGRVTALPWGIPFSDGTLRHPVALYHVLFLLVILLVVAGRRGKKQRDGGTFFLFCLLYAAFAFLAEFSRCTDLAFCEAHPGGLTVTQWALLFFLAAFPILRRYAAGRESGRRGDSAL